MNTLIDSEKPIRCKPGLEPTLNGSTYVNAKALEWQQSQFPKVWIKVLYEDRDKGESTVLIKMEAGAVIPFHRHPELEQAYVLEGSMYDHDGVCRAGEYVWRKPDSCHNNQSDEGAVLLAIYRKPNVFMNGSGYKLKSSK
jgi:quercetin dioxygenase-like cupin family protein